MHILIPALRRQRQVDFCEFDSSLVYRVHSRKVRATHIETLFPQNKTEQNQNVLLYVCMCTLCIQRLPRASDVPELEFQVVVS